MISVLTEMLLSLLMIQQQFEYAIGL